jgi:hypothetical protein
MLWTLIGEFLGNCWQKFLGKHISALGGKRLSNFTVFFEPMTFDHCLC